MCDYDGTGYGYDGLGVAPAAIATVGIGVGKKLFGIFGGGGPRAAPTSPCPGTPQGQQLFEAVSVDSGSRQRLYEHLAQLAPRYQKSIGRYLGTAASPEGLTALALYWAYGGKDCKIGPDNRATQQIITSILKAYQARQREAAPSRQLVRTSDGGVAVASASTLPPWLLPVAVGGAALLLLRR